MTDSPIRMRYLALAVLLFLVAAPSWAADYGTAKVARVTSIYDGDTFRADIPDWPDIVGSRVPVRLAGADTPELRASCDGEKRLARSADVIELRSIERGKYFRLVAQVWLDGHRLGPQLIAQGLARPYEGGHKAGWCG